MNIFKIFLVAGGYGRDYPDTTEILKNTNDKKWTVLENGKLPGMSSIFREGLRLITFDNNVFAFGNLKKYPFLQLSN